MTDPDLSPEQDAVRRLLAEARHDEPAPDAVRARLDATLAELTAERREVRATAPVVDLAARRRRRGGIALAAAAAVVVAGVGIGQVLDRAGTGLGDSGGDSSTSGAAESVPAEDQADAGAPEPSASSEMKARGQAAAAVPGPAVSSSRLRADLRELRSRTMAADTGARDLDEALGCAVVVTGVGDQVPITLDGEPALAVFRPSSGPRQRVDIYDCDAGDELRTLILRAP